MYSQFGGTLVLQAIVLHFVEVGRRERSFSIALKDKRRYFGQLSECRALNASFTRDME